MPPHHRSPSELLAAIGLRIYISRGEELKFLQLILVFLLLIDKQIMADQAFHVRSISLPSRSHPAAAQLEEQLRKLRACVVSPTAEAVCDGGRELGDFYHKIDELLRLPRNQQSLSHPDQRKWVEEELELSLRLLDLSGAVRDGVAAAREHLQDLQIGLRSKSKIVHDDSALRSVKNTITASSKSLSKQIESSRKQAPCTADGDLLVVAGVLAEAREAAFSLLRCASSFVAAPRTKPRDSRWRIVSEALQRKKKKVACEVQEIEGGGESMVALFSKINDIEIGLESLFRRLIQNRVALLNIFSF